MPQPITRRQFEAARAYRLNILAEIQAKMKSLDRNEEDLTKSLREAAPSHIIVQYLEDECVIEDLITHGNSTRKIRYGKDYGFTDPKKVKEAFRALKEAWGGAIEVTFSGEPHRMQVSITIA